MFLGEQKNKTVYITLTGLETTTESTSATIEEPTVSTTTVVSTVPTTTAPIAPSIPDAPVKIAKVNKQGFASQSLVLFRIIFINIFSHNSESCQQYCNTYQQHYPPYLYETGN